MLTCNVFLALALAADGMALLAAACCPRGVARTRLAPVRVVAAQPEVCGLTVAAAVPGNIAFAWTQPQRLVARVCCAHRARRVTRADAAA